MKTFVIASELERILKAMDSNNEFQTVIEHNGKFRAVYVNGWFIQGQMEPDSVESDSVISYTDYTSLEAQSIISKNNDVSHAIRNCYLIDMLKTMIEGDLDISMFNYASKNQLMHAIEAMANISTDETEWLGDPTASFHERYDGAVDLTAKLISYYERA